MKYRVLYTQRILADIKEQVAYLQNEQVAPRTIDRWFSELFDAIDGLYEWPLRCPVDDAKSARFGFEVRKMNFGDYLIHYRVDPEARVVHVMSFQHGSRRR